MCKIEIGEVGDDQLTITRTEEIPQHGLRVTSKFGPVKFSPGVSLTCVDSSDEEHEGLWMEYRDAVLGHLPRTEEERKRNHQLINGATVDSKTFIKPFVIFDEIYFAWFFNRRPLDTRYCPFPIHEITDTTINGEPIERYWINKESTLREPDGGYPPPSQIQIPIVEIAL